MAPSKPVASISITWKKSSVNNSLSWYRLHVHVSAELAEQAAEVLQHYGASAVSMQSADDTELYEPAPDETPLWTDTIITGLFAHAFTANDIIQALQQSLGIKQNLQWFEDTLEDQAWERVWMSRYQPMQFGSRLWICPSWCEPPDPNAANVMLDPGLAFGSGQHASTALCLQWLATQNDLGGKTVIDFGCGSGILAIAALKLGASSAWGVDHDKQAVRSSRENAKHNRLAGQYTAVHSKEFSQELQADIVLANILAQPLIDLAADLSKMVKPGGQLVLAGLLSEQSVAVQAAYDDAFCFIQTEKDGWCLLAGTKNPRLD